MNCYNMIFIGEHIYIYNPILNSLWISWLVFWITVPVKNNIICELLLVVLFIEIIILVTFVEEEVAGFEET